MLARLGTDRLGDQTLGDHGELEDSSGGRRIKERWAGVHLWGDRLEEKSDEVRRKDVHRAEESGRKRQPTLSMMPREIPPSVIGGPISLGQAGVMG